MSAVILPWPPKELNPNSRNHWAKTAKFKKSYRQICWALALEAKIRVSTTGEDPILLGITFFPPDRRGRDTDNMFAAMKAGLDGIADALQVNDKRFVFNLAVSKETLGQVKVELL
jgi:crossover junction endodeoxyribonuclease RusA